MKKYLLILFIFYVNNLFSQDTTIVPPLTPPIIDSTTNESNKVFTIVDNMPQFPGGDEELFKYLADNIHYPRKERSKGITGKVYVSFIINTDGSVTGAKILKGVSEGLDNEALRVVSSMPKWSPGSIKGKPVAIYYNLPIKFTIRDLTK